MTPTYLRTYILPAAYALLPIGMDTHGATAMLIAIAMQESQCCHRRQIAGPARGLWQFEVAGVRGVLTHRASKPHMAEVLARLVYPVTDLVGMPYAAIEHNDVLAACFARLLLWTLPAPLPGRTDVETGWAQYLETWKPGRPRRDSWDASWAAGWAA